MCDRRYDLDRREAVGHVLQQDTVTIRDGGGGVSEQVVVPTHNNNTQLLSREQPQQQPQQQKQQNKQLHSLENLQQAEEALTIAPTEESGNEISTTAPTLNQHRQSSKLLSKSVGIDTQPVDTVGTGSMSSWRSENLITCMLITANVGTIFEESSLLELWFDQLKSHLIKIKPQLVAIHCQEVGGKNYETSMKNVSSFTDKILGDEKIIGDYSRVRIFLDENFECLEKFTALGSLYLVHDSVDNVKLYNFKTAQYDVVEGRNIEAASDKRDLLSGCRTKLNGDHHQDQQQNITKPAEHIEKIKFPLELFPECRWSRKGFMRTRWLLNDCQPLDLVNIHLFHDASNLVAMNTTPSPYAQTRQKALEFALSKISEPLRQLDNNNRGQASQQNSISDSPTSPTVESPSQKQSQQQLKSNRNHPESHQQQQQQQPVPLFIFGDFNFRLNTSKVIQRITEGISPVVKRNESSDEVLEIVYHRKTSNCARADPVCSECDKHDSTRAQTNNSNSSSEDNGNEVQSDEGGVLMTVGKKLFDYENLDETFRATKNTEWLLELDNELDSFKSQLYEFKISFSPSYPFKEDQSGGYSYMKTRCPAWCDRILFNEAGYRLISAGANKPRVDIATPTKLSEAAPAVDGAAPPNPDSEKHIECLQSQGDVVYRLMGSSVPMGDHKPVLLYCQLDIAQSKRRQQSQSQQQHEQHQQNPSSTKKCNRTVISAAANANSSIQDHLVESTAM